MLQRENLINRANTLCQYASIETKEEKNYLRKNRNSILRMDWDSRTWYLLGEALNVQFKKNNKAEEKQVEKLKLLSFFHCCFCAKVN